MSATLCPRAWLGPQTLKCEGRAAEHSAASGAKVTLGQENLTH